MRKVFALILMLVSFSVLANSASDDLIKLFKNTTTISGDFTQTVYDQSAHPISNTQGNFKIARPNKFRWDAQKPMQQLTVANGKTIWLYQPELEQVTMSPMTEKVGQTPLAILSGSTSALSKNFTISEPQTNQFLLIAKDTQSPFHSIALSVKGKVVTQMVLTDALGQKTIISFQNVRLNQSISSSQFEFTPPKGVDVIKG